jgi:hypothetical protein
MSSGRREARSWVVVGLFCVSTVNIVCAIKAAVPVRAEDVLDLPRIQCR